MLLFLALASCGGASSSDDVAAPSSLAGTYHLVSHVTLPAASVAPGAAGDVLDLLDGLANKPATTLLSLADSAGVPAADVLAAALPDALQSRLDGWMKDYLATAPYGGSSVYAELVQANGLVQSVAASFELQSDLLLVPSPGQAGTHSPHALVFFESTSPVAVPLLASQVTAAQGVRASVAWPGAEDAKVTIADHAMGIPFGQYALVALHTALERTFGAQDLAGVLAQLVDCSAMALSVAGQCVGPICVGHASEWAAVCTAGLQRAASEIEAQVTSLDFKAIHFQSGHAKALDCVASESATVTADRLTAGTWSLTVDLGSGEKPASGTFEGTR